MQIFVDKVYFVCEDMHMKRKPTDFASTRIPVEIKDKLERIAERERRSVSQLIRIAIEQYVQKESR
jgi:predicted DNA-binding protein